MLCDRCQKRPANVYLSKIVNGQKTELRLCQECAAEMGEAVLPGFPLPQFNFNSLLAGLFNQIGPGEGMGGTEEVLASGVRCPNCGFTYENFRSTGLFGCSECYKAFDRYLDQVLRRIQGSTEHTGKVPVRIAGPGDLDRQIIRLRSQLQLAVEREEYERAATLRDQIRALEEERRQKEAQGGAKKGEKEERPTAMPPR